MIDNDFTGFGAGVSITHLLDGRHDPALGGQHVGRPTGRSRLDLDRRAAFFLSLGTGRGSDPGDIRVSEQETGAGRDRHDGPRLIAFAHLGLDPIGVVAFGAQDGDGVLGGVTGATPRLEPVFDGTFDFADGLNDPLAQIIGHFPGHVGARFGPGLTGAVDADGSRGDGCEDGSSHANTSRPPTPSPCSEPKAVCHRGRLSIL